MNIALAPDGSHYLVDGQRMERVTHVLDALPSSHLMDWAAKVERYQCLRLAQDGKLNSTHAVQPYRHEVLKREAAELGTILHKSIEEVFNGKLFARPSVELAAALRWVQMANLIPVHFEALVASHDLGVAGTLDLFAELTLHGLASRIHAVTDWKTANFFSLANLIQVSVYRHCMIEMGLADEDTYGVVVKLPKKGKKDAEIHVVTPTEARRYVETFRALKRVHQEHAAFQKEYGI